jgi:quercetin dioxygenase-like cupin family protein
MKKMSKATNLRPDADRIIDASMVKIDLPAFIEQTRMEKSYLENGRNAMTVFKTKGMIMVLIILGKGAEMIRHKTSGLVSVHVLEGQIEFHTEDEKVGLSKGQALALHEGIYHSVTAKEEAAFLLTHINTLEEV